MTDGTEPLRVLEAPDQGNGEMPPWASAALATPNDRTTLDVDGCAINCLTWGNRARRPLILVHGTAASAEWWRFIAPLLAVDWFVVALDLGGMGDSSHCGRYERQRNVEQIVAVAKAFDNGLAPLLVGHSLGGYITLLTGVSHGERFAGIIVIESAVDDPAAPHPRPVVQSNAPHAIYASLDEAIRRFLLIPAQPVECGFYLRHIARESVRESEGGWQRKFDPAALVQPRPPIDAQQARHMRCPVALIWGERSERFNASVLGYMRTLFGPGLAITQIPAARHHIMLDQPLALVSAIRCQAANW